MEDEEEEHVVASTYDWITCSKCGTWRRVTKDVIAALGDDDVWYCTDNTDSKFAACTVAEEVWDPVTGAVGDEAVEAMAAANKKKKRTKKKTKVGSGGGGAGGDRNIRAGHLAHTHGVLPGLASRSVTVLNPSSSDGGSDQGLASPASSQGTIGTVSSSGRGLHSSTSQLNVSTFLGIC